MNTCCNKCSHRCPDCYDNIHCYNSECLCHQEPIADWEEQFKMFYKAARNGWNVTPTSFNNFIRGLLTQERAEIIKVLEGMSKHTDVTGEKDVYERGYSVGNDAGFNDALSAAIDLIKKR